MKEISFYYSSDTPTGLVSIVIPALNEEDGIGKTLSEIPVMDLKEMGFGLEIIVVDGNSNDHTTEIAKDFGTEVLMEHRKGYGRAYKTGFSYAKGDLIVALDADSSYPASEIPRLLGIVKNHELAFLSTNRFDFVEDGAMNPINRFGNKFLSFLVFVLFSVRLFDSQSGMWVFRRECLHDILPDSDGMSFSQEIKIKAFRSVKALEVSTSYRRRIGRAKIRIFTDGLKNLLHLLKLRILFSIRN